MTPRLRSMFRRLNRLELEHLREHCTELERQLEAEKARAERAEIRAEQADRCAEMWQDDLQALHDRLAESDDARQIGLARDGRVVLIERSTEVRP